MDKNKSYTYQKMQNEIKQRLRGRKYALGLDLGVGSIGVAAIALEGRKLQPTDVVYANSRIFDPSEGASDRRAHRGQRNSLRHRANRLEFLWKLLAEKGLMLPFSREIDKNPARLRFSANMLKRDPYKIREAGCREQISLEELGVALYHIANHRGSSSCRFNKEETQSDKDLKQQESLSEEIIKEKHCRTYIEVLQNWKAQGNKKVRNTGSEKDVPMPTRDIITSELDILLAEQAKYYPDVLTENYISQIKKAILYENPMIVPEAGNCPYFSDELKLPKSAFINEERRLWEAVNNIRVECASLSKTEYRKLSDEQRKIAYNCLREGKKLDDGSFKRLFPEFKRCKVALQGVDKKKQEIKGFAFKALENKPFWGKFSDDEKNEFVRLYVNTPDDATLKAKYIDDFALSEEEIVDLFKTVKLSGDYAPVGLSAMKIILNYIINDACTYQEAEHKAIEEGMLESKSFDEEFFLLPYYGKAIPNSTKNVMGKAWHSSYIDKLNTPGFHKPETNEEEEKYGKIANPVVHQTLNELRKLVNEVIGIFGAKPERITVELGRELKLGKEERDNLSRENSNKESRNAKIYSEYCAPHTGEIKTNEVKNCIKKFRFFEDQNKKCPYCLKTITTDDIIRGNVDFDHILPREDTADSSEINLILAHRNCNEKKGKRIPYEAFGADIENGVKSDNI